MPIVATDRRSAKPPRKGASKETHNAKKFAITVRIEPDGRQVRLEGRAAWALKELIKAGSRGVTATDARYRAESLVTILEDTRVAA